MKAIYYFPILGLIISFVVIALIGGPLRYQSGESMLMPFLVAAAVLVSAGAFLGRYLSNKFPAKFSKIRPLIYWPTIALLAAVFTKGGDYLSLSIWLAIGVAVGFLKERFGATPTS